MNQYLLSMYQPEGPIPPPEVLARVMRDLDAIGQEIKDAGGWVFSGGLHPPDTATVLSYAGGDVLTTDGPFVEGKEYLGGFWIVEAPDLDVAMTWGRKIVEATTLPIEVRPFRELPRG
ncbi:MAG TPA: YciI family protein [Streptosporangiaceae bacterium]|nr:YciI family protein [Streptosporangiaceae bacterium]